jgi:hypothetical protein
MKTVRSNSLGLMMKIFAPFFMPYGEELNAFYILDLNVATV